MMDSQYWRVSEFVGTQIVFPQAMWKDEEMAKIEIKNATVTRLIPNYGFKAVCEIPTKNGDPRKETYTIWTDAKVEEGSMVDIAGNLSVKVEEYTNKEGKLVRYAAIHVNNALVKADTPF